LTFTFAALFGAVWGSFLNVVIVRLPLGQSVVSPGSRCVACGAAVRAYDNIPVLSYLVLRGRCRKCGVRFSPRYALVEAAMGAAGVAVVAVFGPTLAALGFYVFLWLGLGIAAIDLEHWIIPHELSWTGIALGLVFSLVNPRANWKAALLGAGIAWLVFTLMSWVGEKIFKKEALGLGDRWLFAMEGAFLGAGALLPIVFLSSLQGSIVGLLLIAIGKAQTGQPKADATKPAAAVEEGNESDDWVPPKNAIPFGPFLALAGIEWLFFGPAVWAWYAAKLAAALH
jgi:leader peptidase (prepilin peptidase)/N-methyltransferase